MIGIVSTPIITRLYAPADFSVLVIYSAVLSLALTFASLRYEFALPLPKDNVTAGNLLILSMLLVIITTSLTGISLAICGRQFVALIHAPALVPYIWLLVPGLFGAGIYQVLNYWAVRKRDYDRIAKTKLSQSFGGSLSKILLGFLPFGPLGLLFGEVIAQASGSGTLALMAWKKDRDVLNKVSFAGITSVAAQYSRFPIYSCIASLLNSLALQLPVLALSYIYGPKVTGLYGLAYSIIVLPTALISISLSQAYFGEVAELVRDNPGELEHLYIKTTQRLTIFTIPMVVITALSAPVVFPSLFGSKWAEAGIYCLPLMLVVIPAVVVSPLSNLSTYGFNQWQLAWDAFRAFLICICFLVSYRIGLSVLPTLTAYGFVMLTMYFVIFLMNILAIRKLNQKFNRSRSKRLC